MSDKHANPGKAEREAEKARRLAEALRANLGRRKARQRSRAAGEASEAEPGEELRAPVAPAPLSHPVPRPEPRADDARGERDDDV